MPESLSTASFHLHRAIDQLRLCRNEVEEKDLGRLAVIEASAESAAELTDQWLKEQQKEAVA